MYENDFSVEFFKANFADNVLLNNYFFFYALVNVARKLFIEFLEIMSDENRFNEILLEEPQGKINVGIGLMERSN